MLLLKGKMIVDFTSGMDLNISSHSKLSDPKHYQLWLVINNTVLYREGILERLRRYCLPGNWFAPQPAHCVGGSTAQEVEVSTFWPFHISPLAGGAPVEEPPSSLEGGALVEVQEHVDVEVQ